MQLLIVILSISLLIFLAYQDFKERAISWWLIPVLFILLSVERIVNEGAQNYATAVAINLMIIAIQLGVVTIYFSIKNKKLINIADTLLGWGDILFFIVLSAALSPVNFVLGYTVSLVVVLTCWLIYKGMFKPEIKTIPLAGGMAIILCVGLLVAQVYPQFSLNQNTWLW